jgi:hypothetical protein
VRFTRTLTISNPCTKTFLTLPCHDCLQAGNEVGLMLKHHNAVGLQIANYIKTKFVQENSRFLDHFVSVMAESCICCSLRTLPCIAQNMANDKNPKISNLYRRSREITDSEGKLSPTNL